MWRWIGNTAAALKGPVAIAAIGATALLLLAGGFASASPPSLTRVSVNDAGEEGNRESALPAISGDGRFVAFSSAASNLVPDDTNTCGPLYPKRGSCEDVFVHDRLTGTTERVSVSSRGEQANDLSGFPSLSADGRFVAFHSAAPNLVPGDTNRTADVFLHDRSTKETVRVSVVSGGAEASGGYYSGIFPAISENGRFVAFWSDASNLVPGDTNGKADTFVHDVQTGLTERVSVGTSGEQGNDESRRHPSINADGRYVAFESWATNLVPGDQSPGVFVRDRLTGSTETVNLDNSGRQGAYPGTRPSISGDGRSVAFWSGSPLVAGDTVGGDVYVRHLDTATTTRVTVAPDGAEANNWFRCCGPSISYSGRFVAFESYASNLVSGDDNGFLDVFVHDQQTGITFRASSSSDGEQGNYESGFAKISSDGRIVAFQSIASNLVVADTNDFCPRGNCPDVFANDLGDTDGDEKWDPFDLGDEPTRTATPCPRQQQNPAPQLRRPQRPHPHRRQRQHPHPHLRPLARRPCRWNCRQREAKLIRLKASA